MAVLSKGHIPKICLPLTSKTKEEIKRDLAILIEKKPDMIELRADFLNDIAETEAVIHIVQFITNQTDIPLLFTIRSKREGGQPISLNEAEVVQLLCEIASNTKVTMIDYEVNNEIEHIQQVVHTTHRYDKQIVMSYHNFTETPDDDRLLDYFSQMELLKADVAKVAVMPNSKADVLRLLQLTAEADEQLNIPIITMSMGELGEMSRVISWIYGSVLTFAVGVESSAPGQIPFEQLKTAIKTLQQFDHT